MNDSVDSVELLQDTLQYCFLNELEIVILGLHSASVLHVRE